MRNFKSLQSTSIMSYIFSNKMLNYLEFIANILFIYLLLGVAYKESFLLYSQTKL